MRQQMMLRPLIPSNPHVLDYTFSITLDSKCVRWLQGTKNHSAVLDYSLIACKVFLRDSTGRNHTFYWKDLGRFCKFLQTAEAGHTKVQIYPLLYSSNPTGNQSRT